MQSAHQYLALLRGVNVGGKAILKMADLQQALVNEGFDHVRTYIQSGNVIFASSLTDKKRLATRIQSTIKKTFGLEVDIVLFTATEWQAIVTAAPKWWGTNDDWKHNLLVYILFYMPIAKQTNKQPLNILIA